jgi:opacity protein-like surface antigen
MGSLKALFLVSGAVIGMTSLAQAADLLPPPPPMEPAPMMSADFSGWYLRGDVGMAIQSGNLSPSISPNPLIGAPADAFNSFYNPSLSASALFDVGVGYQINNWLRFDVTGEYRAKAHFHGQQVATFGGIILPDDYHASKSEWLFLANAYVDLGTWWCVTPFIGAGVGGSYNKISSFTDIGATQVGATILSTTYGNDASKFNFAWAVYAGLAYQVTPSFTVELAYRYLNLGSATTGPTNSFDGVTVVNGTPFQFNNLTSQDIKLGVRWMFGEPPPPPPPLMRKG